MKLTRTERWILSNQLSILEKIDPEQAEYYIYTKKILDYGYELLYDESIPFIFPDGDTMSDEECKMVLDIFDMFRAITLSLTNIEDKSGIRIASLNFSGFDGNEEGKYQTFARFFCDEYGGKRFEEIGKGDFGDFNSHSPTLETYERMVTAWKKSKKKFELTKEELQQISLEAIHPANRSKFSDLFDE